MRSRIYLTLFALATSPSGLSQAQETTPTVRGPVYRCTKLDGFITYSNKPIDGGDCVQVGSYKKPSEDSAPPGWLYLASSTISDTYVQTSSIKRSGERIGVWTMENYREPQTSNFTTAPYLSAMRRLSVKCGERHLFAQKTTFMAAAFGRGAYVGEWRPLGTYGDFATPGSIDDAVAKHVCQRSKK